MGVSTHGNNLRIWEKHPRNGQHWKNYNWYHFNRYILSEDNKKIGKNVHPLINGTIPKKHISSDKNDTSPHIANSLEKIGESHLRGQLALAGAITSAMGGIISTTDKTSEIYSFEFYSDKCESMSPIYEDGNITIGQYY